MCSGQFKDITTGDEFDVVIIGGGINGIGVYRELALQGLKVLLVEKNDFCSRASAAPSRMIHGGLRYLENAEFDLVRESLAERDRLLKNAPHLVMPLSTIVPIRSYFSGMFNASLRFFKIERPTTERGAVIVKIGLWFYEVFTRKSKTVPMHKFHGRRKTLAMFPHMRTDLKCSAQYYDAWIKSPERMAFELIKEGDKAQGSAFALNYCTAAFSGNGKLTITSSLTADTRSVSAKSIINATGAWIDEVNAEVGLNSKYVFGTKGSHIILDNQQLYDELNGSMVYYENSENRVCILFPYLGKVLVGSTDLPVSDLSSITCTDEEMDYILESLGSVFPTVPIQKDQIVYTFSGVRPLATASAETAGQIPRSHQLKIDSLGGVPMISLVGGKWTTFRAFAEEATDHVLGVLAKKRIRSTRDLAIGGGNNYPTSKNGVSDYLNGLRDDFKIPLDIVRNLFERYGTEVETLLAYSTVDSKSGVGSDLSQMTPLLHAEHYYQEEIKYITQFEYVGNLTDIVKRRTNLALEGRVTNDLLIEVALICQRHLKWSADDLREQLTACAENLANEHHCNVSSNDILIKLERNLTTGESYAH